MDAELIKLAIRKTARGKRKRPYIRKVSDNPEDYVEYYRRYVISYLPVDREPKVIYDGIQKKKRKIYRPTFDEQVMHTMVVEVLKPIIMTELYPHVHGSIPEHGAQIMASSIGPLKDTNTYNMYKDRIKPFVNFGKIKHYISEFDRRANVCGAA